MRAYLDMRLKRIVPDEGFQVSIRNEAVYILAFFGTATLFLPQHLLLPPRIHSTSEHAFSGQIFRDFGHLHPVQVLTSQERLRRSI